MTRGLSLATFYHPLAHFIIVLAIRIIILITLLFGLQVAFRVHLYHQSPEVLIVGKWSEDSREFEVSDEPDEKQEGLLNAEFVDDEIPEIHTQQDDVGSEWHFHDDDDGEIVNYSTISEPFTYHIKGRGNMLQLVDHLGHINKYKIRYIDEKQLILTYKTESPRRGIVKLMLHRME